MSDGRSPGEVPAAAAGALSVALLIEAETWGDEASARAWIEPAVAAVEDAIGLDAPDGVELSVVLTDDERIRALNHQWRGIDKATNVLSFPIDEEDDGPLLGDVVIARETTLREAAEEGKLFAHHATHLLVHGILHLFGYDHERDAAGAEDMERLEADILARLGIPDPYFGTDPDGPDDGVAVETKAP
jgi:probable rRNA maturation factor